MPTDNHSVGHGTAVLVYACTVLSRICYVEPAGCPCIVLYGNKDIHDGLVVPSMSTK